MPVRKDRRRSWVSRRRSSRIGSERKVFREEGLDFCWRVSDLGEVEEVMVVMVDIVG